jgi:hypothetical protein
MPEKRNDCPASSSGYLFREDSGASLFERFLGAPGASWVGLRVFVMFGPLVLIPAVVFRRLKSAFRMKNALWTREQDAVLIQAVCEKVSIQRMVGPPQPLEILYSRSRENAWP